MKYFLVFLLMLIPCAFAQTDYPGEPDFSEFTVKLYRHQFLYGRQEKAYWDKRKFVFDKEIESCRTISEDSSRVQCYNQIRESENEKTEHEKDRLMMWRTRG